MALYFFYDILCIAQEIIFMENKIIDEEAVIDLPLIAFLDTSVIDPMFNNFFFNKDFEILKKHVDNNNVSLITHEIVINEVRSHINDKLKIHIEKFECIQKSRELLIAKSMKEFQRYFYKISENEIIEKTFKKFITLMKLIKVEVLKTGNFSSKKLLCDYFQNKPPFGKKDKKYEFPDAIMLQSLKRNVKQNDKIHILANDGDWKNVCDQDDCFILHKSLKEFLDYLNNDNKIRVKIKEFISSLNTQKIVFDKIKEILESITFTIHGLEYDRKGIISGHEYDETIITDIFDVEYKLDTIEDISLTSTDKEQVIQSTLTILCSAKIKAECNFLDEESSGWDSESGEYIYKEYVKVDETHEILFSLQLELKAIYNNEQLNFDIVTFEIIDDDYDISKLNNMTLINREYNNNTNNMEEEWYSEGKFIVERVFICPHCGKEIVINLISGDTECVATSERNMGIESEYSISVQGNCSHCKNGFEVVGSVWEYPVLAFNYEQGVKIIKK